LLVISFVIVWVLDSASTRLLIYYYLIGLTARTGLRGFCDQIPKP
jgi:hypothetical protein